MGFYQWHPYLCKYPYIVFARIWTPDHKCHSWSMLKDVYIFFLFFFFFLFTFFFSFLFFFFLFLFLLFIFFILFYFICVCVCVCVCDFTLGNVEWWTPVHHTCTQKDYYAYNLPYKNCVYFVTQILEKYICEQISQRTVLKLYNLCERFLLGPILKLNFVFQHDLIHCTFKLVIHTLCSHYLCKSKRWWISEKRDIPDRLLGVITELWIYYGHKGNSQIMKIIRIWVTGRLSLSGYFIEDIILWGDVRLSCVLYVEIVYFGDDNFTWCSIINDF